MAKYLVNCEKCNEEFKVALFGKNKTREWKLETYSWICEECKEKEYDENNKKAQKNNHENNLPELKGSDKQIMWAETIRNGYLNEIENYISKKNNEEINEILETYPQTIDNLLLKDSASWWIDHRNTNIKMLFNEVKTDKEKIKTKRLEYEVKLEATVKPQKSLTETIAEITIKDKTINVDFPEKNEKFRLLIKNLGYSWSSGWYRKINLTTGSIEDRAAELGNQLLSNGFIICIIDDNLRNKAINADYEPEHTRWIMKRTSGKFQGWFAISWKKHHEDFYNEARKITGSKWSNPSVVIRPEHFEQVIDFAEQYDFKLSDGAMKVISEAKTRKENILVPKNISKPKKSTTVNKEKEFVAIEGEIDESLRDND